MGPILKDFKGMTNRSRPEIKLNVSGKVTLKIGFNFLQIVTL
jgi:hypothetical protein